MPGNVTTAAAFGIVGDGVTNDTAAFQNLANWANALSQPATIYLGGMKIKITSSIAFSKTVILMGEGGTIYCSGSSTQLQFNLNSDDDYVGSTVKLHDVKIITDQTIMSTTPLRIRVGASNLGSAISAVLEDCEFSGINGSAGFPFAAEFINCAFVTIENCRILGDRSNKPLKSAGGFYFNAEPGFEKGDNTIRRLMCFFVTTGITIRGHQEGVKLSESTFVACMTAVDYRGDTDQSEPLFTAWNNHFNTEQYGIYLERIHQFNINNNNFYNQNVNQIASSYCAVDCTTQNGPSLQSTFTGNTLYLSGAQTGRTAVSVKSDGIGRSSMILDSNSIWGATVGFNLGANTQGCYVGLANIYENTTNPIVDTGSGNIINLTNAGGFVGIGKANPQQRLDVAGAIACTNGFVFSGGPGIFAGSGSPQGALTAPMGSLFLRTDAGTLFVKQTGSGNSGWVAK